MMDFLDAHDSHSPEVIRLFTRHAHEPIKSPNYIPNISDSLREAFAPWFERRTDQSFKAMLKLQHTILASGIDGEAPYLSTSFLQPLSSQGVGRFRYESLRLPDNAYLQFTISDFFNSSSIPYAFRTFLEESSGEYYRVPILAVPTTHRPEARILTLTSPRGLKEYLVRYRYPSRRSTRIYVEEMSKIMERLRALPLSTPKETVIEHLADYVQVFSAGLPFERVNFSLAMAQVNYVLMNHGLRGIENGELDLISIIAPTSRFREIFAEAVKKGQIP